MSDLSFHVRQFVPDCEGVELELRQSLLIARDYAADLKSKATSGLAYDQACSAHEMAGLFVFADASTDRLKIALAYVRNAVHASFLAEHLDSGDRLQ
ncbi:hypothetical protein ACWPM1_07675 [Tsuneonella sp. HG249]